EPHTTEEKIFKILPGGNFDLTLPISPKFGIVLTGSSSDRYAKLHYSYNTYNAVAAGTGATPEKPFLQSYRLLDSPRVLTRQSGGIKADWKVTKNSVLSFGYQASHFESKRIATEFNINVGTNPTPNPATAIPLTFGPDFVSGATGRGSMTTGGAASVHGVTDTMAGNLRYRFDNGVWRVQVGVDQSRAVGGYRDTAKGHFRQMGISLRGASRVVFRDIMEVRPGTIEVYDVNNQLIDYTNPANYQLTTANSTPRRTDDRFESGFADVRRTLDFLPFPASVQVGALERNHTRDIRRRNENWTYNGINGDRSPVPFLSQVHTNEYHYYGFRGFPLISPKLAWEAFQANPALFSKTAAQAVTEETFRRVNSEYFDETVTAYYAQIEFSLLKSRLKGLTGVRYEKTVTEGQGPLIDNAAIWQRNPDGSFVRDPVTNLRLRKPEAGAANSMEQLNLTHVERGYRANRSYDGLYPSLHLNYDLTENLVLRGAYAKTYGRPNLTDVIPTATVDEADLDDDEIGDPSIVQGNITLRNTGLKPWSADNYDLSLEYYTKQGGIFSAGVFLKEITDFFGTDVRIATLADTEQLGIDPRYVGWRISTKFNSGDARVTGAEFNIRQSLRELGEWGRHFNVFINGTKLELQGDRDADFSAFTPESLNWGFSYNRKPIMFMAKWNYRGKRRLAAFPNLGPDAYAYDDRRLTLDLNAEIQIRKAIFFYVAAQNVFNVPSLEMRYGSSTPDYAKDHRWGYNGVGITMGIKGTF
ncbi:MAG TPA: TonB-dependent receptor, partial [Opitutaceae bacterium]|nr:TonB-dependent receptor [Opitutaceae bacterium]